MLVKKGGRGSGKGLVEKGEVERGWLGRGESRVERGLLEWRKWRGICWEGRRVE